MTAKWGVIVDDNFLNIISKESHLTPEELRREHKREFLELKQRNSRRLTRRFNSEHSRMPW